MLHSLFAAFHGPFYGSIYLLNAPNIDAFMKLCSILWKHSCFHELLLGLQPIAAYSSTFYGSIHASMSCSWLCSPYRAYQPFQGLLALHGLCWVYKPFQGYLGNIVSQFYGSNTKPNMDPQLILWIHSMDPFSCTAHNCELFAKHCIAGPIYGPYLWTQIYFLDAFMNACIHPWMHSNLQQHNPFRVHVQL